MPSVSEAQKSRLDRDPPEREPPRELFLDRQLLAELGLEDELAFAVALLAPAGWRERIERAPLVVVDPVHAAFLRVLEGEHRAQDALAIAAGLERAAHRVDPDHQVVELAAAQDQPAESVAVVL